MGNMRPLYVQRNPIRLNCANTPNQSSGRFIPLNSNILSITVRTLSDWVKNFGHLDPVIISTILDRLPLSSRETRKSKRHDRTTDNQAEQPTTKKIKDKDRKTTNQTEGTEVLLPKHSRLMEKFPCPYPQCTRTYSNI